MFNRAPVSLAVPGGGTCWVGHVRCKGESDTGVTLLEGLGTAGVRAGPGGSASGEGGGEGEPFPVGVEGRWRLSPLRMAGTGEGEGGGGLLQTESSLMPRRGSGGVGKGTFGKGG